MTGPSDALVRVVTAAHDLHLSRRHPDAQGWNIYPDCSMCSDLATARDEAGIGKHTRYVTTKGSQRDMPDEAFVSPPTPHLFTDPPRRPRGS